MIGTFPGTRPGRKHGRGSVLRTGAGRSDPRRRTVSAHLRPERRGGRLGIAGGLAHFWPMTPTEHSQPRVISTSAAASPTSSSRFQAPRRDCRPSRRAIFAGIPVNVTLLFSREQYVAAADAYLRGVERRIEAGLNPAVASVASLFVSRWDVAVSGKVPAELTNRLGIAIAQRTYKAYREFLASARLQRAAQCRRAGPAASLGQHRYQGPERPGHPLCEGARRTFHDQHHARGHSEGLRRPRRGRRDARTGRGGLRDGSGRFRQGGCRHRRPGRPPPERRGVIFRQVPGTI